MNLKEKIDDLNIQIRESCSDHENEIFPIYDGALNLEEYATMGNLKIMWLMKEAYDDNDREGDWSYPDFYMKDYERFYKDLVRGKSNRTWQPIVYTSYGILNNFLLFDDISYIHEDSSIVKILDKIAIVNIQKLPSSTGSRTILNNVIESYRIHKKIIADQFDLLKPDIVICANVFSIIKNDLQIIQEGKFNSVDYYRTKERLYINAYHPAQKTISKEKYVNDIISCVKENVSILK